MEGMGWYGYGIYISTYIDPILCKAKTLVG